MVLDSYISLKRIFADEMLGGGSQRQRWQDIF